MLAPLLAKEGLGEVYPLLANAPAAGKRSIVGFVARSNPSACGISPAKGRKICGTF
jgi:L-amino acid N-acyltransferase YncA